MGATWTGPTPEITAALARELGQGKTVPVACALAGISESTFFRWLSRGRIEAARVAARGIEVDLLPIDSPEFLDSERLYIAHARAMEHNRARHADAVESTLVELATVGVESTKTTHRTWHAIVDDEVVELSDRTVTTERRIDPTTVRWLAERLDRASYAPPAQRLEIEHRNAADAVAHEHAGVAAELHAEFIAELFAAVDEPGLRERLEAAGPEAWATAWQRIYDRHSGEPVAELEEGDDFDQTTDRYKAGGA